MRRTKLVYLWRVELCRLLQSPFAWLAVTAVAASGLSGLFVMGSSTMASRYLAQPISGACQLGTLIFALLTLRELSRVQRGGMDVLCDAVVPPKRMAVVRLAALVAFALAASVVLMVLYAPVAVIKLGVVFSLGDYLACFLLLLFPALAFGCVAAAACYQIMRRVETSALLVAAFWMVSGSGLCRENFLWQWYLPTLPALSDDFSNAMIFRLAADTRLVWLCLLGWVWVMSLLCLRRYGKGFLGSLRQGLRKPWTAAAAVCLLACGGLLWQFQPFYDKSPVDWMTVEQPDYYAQGVRVAGIGIEADVGNGVLGRLTGRATYTLQNSAGKAQPFYFALNAGYKIEKMTANGVPVAFSSLHDDYIAASNWRCELPADKDITLDVEYSGVPRLWNAMQYSAGGGMLISANYVQLKGKEVAPVPQAEVLNEETPCRLQIRLPQALTLVSSGYEAQKLQDNADGTATWLAHDKGTEGLSVFAGDYVKVDLKGGGMPIEFYYSRKHEQQIKTMGAIEAMEDAIEFCTRNYGPRAFTQDRPFKIIQVTELLFGGFARDNISAVGESSFTAENLTDVQKGASGAEVLAHEIVHQWWGLGVMLQDPNDIYWGSEGITTYTTYRLLKELRGEAYADAHYREEWERNVAQIKRNFYLRNPEYRAMMPEAFSADLSAQVQSVNEYSGYALMFSRAAKLLGGEDKLDAVLARLYENGGTEMPPYITLGDFLRESGLTKEELQLA